jgi:WYL_2, Sm-like SH3 beta-barrel fold
MSTDNVGYNRNTLLAMLKNRIVEVRFRKADGQHRTLRGTLLEEYLPARKNNTAAAETSKQHENVVTLWDLDEKQWRSVRTDRITDVL